MMNQLALDHEFPRFLREFVTHYSTGPSRAFLRSFEADLLSQLPIEHPVLDLACGDGAVSAITFGCQLDSGCDLMEQQLEKARKRQQYHNLALADARALPYEDQIYATVISNSSIEHIPNVDQVVREVARVLRQGGTFVFTVPGPRFNEWFWLTWVYNHIGMRERGERRIREFNALREHHNVFDADQWRQMLAAQGFQRITVTEYLPFRSTFVFSILEHLWTLNVRVPTPSDKGVTMKRVNPGGAALSIMPARMRVALQVFGLSRFRGASHVRRGSHLLVVART